MLADQAVDEGWKGRAQQIVMLKSKVSRLEREGGGAGGKQPGAGTSRPRGGGAQAKGVDAKADEELSSMSQERQQAVEVGGQSPEQSRESLACLLHTGFQ
jgi:hypothetical protein